MRPSHIRIFIFVLVSLAFIGWAIPTAANFIIEYNWWKEVGQVDTWISMLWYSIAPAAVGALMAFIALYVAHSRGLHFAGVRQRDFPVYSRLVPVGLAAHRDAGSRRLRLTSGRSCAFSGRAVSPPLPDAWQDRVFSHPLPFYLFDLPFYSDLLGFVFGLAIFAALLFWVTARGWQLFERVRYGRLLDGPRTRIDFGEYLHLPGATRTAFVRVLAVILLLGFAAWVFLGNL